jgi:hypothetical protein
MEVEREKSQEVSSLKGSGGVNVLEGDGGDFGLGGEHC